MTHDDDDRDIRALLEADAARTGARHDDAVLRAARESVRTAAGTRGGVAGARAQMAVRWSLAAAAAGIGLAVVLGWQLFEQQRQTLALQSERAALQGEHAALTRSLATMEERLAAALQSRDTDRSPPTEVRPAPALRLLASAVLIPGLVRGDGGIERIDVPPGSGTVRLQLDLATVSEYPRYRVELYDMKGALLLRQSQLQPQSTRGGRIVSIDVPSQSLASGEYELLLKNAASGGATDDPTYYYFAVRRK